MKNKDLRKLINESILTPRFLNNFICQGKNNKSLAEENNIIHDAIGLLIFFIDEVSGKDMYGPTKKVVFGIDGRTFMSSFHVDDQSNLAKSINYHGEPKFQIDHTYDFPFVLCQVGRVNDVWVDFFECETCGEAPAMYIGDGEWGTFCRDCWYKEVDNLFKEKYAVPVSF